MIEFNWTSLMVGILIGMLIPTTKTLFSWFMSFIETKRKRVLERYGIKD